MKTAIPSRLSPGLRSPRSPRSPRIPRPSKAISSSKLLNSMLDTEERLDRVIAEMPENKPENKEKLPEQLRIFLRFVEDDDGKIVLRVEGLFMKNEFLDKTIGRNRPTPRFMSLVKSLTVTVFDGNGSDRSITLEWKPSSEEADGCDFLMMSNLTKGFAITVEVVLKPTLPDACTVLPIVRRHLKLGDHVNRRSDVALAMWKYIKTHRLLDPADPQSIICDKFLRTLFVSRRITYPELMRKMETVTTNVQSYTLNMEVVLQCERPVDERLYAFDTYIYTQDKPQKRKRNPKKNSQELGVSFAKAQMRNLLAQRNRLLRAQEFYTQFAADPERVAKACVASNQMQQKDPNRVEASRSANQLGANNSAAFWENCPDVVVGRCIEMLKFAESAKTSNLAVKQEGT